MYSNVTISQLLAEKPKNIIDIRNSSYYLMNHIPGAISVEANVLLSTPEKYLKKGETYYIYCSSGKRSSMVVQRLNSLGYSTVNVEGGFNNYLLRN